MQLEIYDIHLTCKVENKCLNVRERVEVIEWDKDGPLPSPIALWVVSVRERKPWQKKKIKNAKNAT